MTPAFTQSKWLHLEQYVEPFERELVRAGEADLMAFVPASGHPQRLAVLCELVRVDLEHRWRRGRPTCVEEYRKRYPELESAPRLLEQIAFEEYRLRYQSGERPLPAEYEQRLGIDASAWPSLTSALMESWERFSSDAKSPAQLGSARASTHETPDGSSLRLSLVPASGPRSTEDLRNLLQKRLRFISVACCAALAYFAILGLLNPATKVGFSLEGDIVVLNWMALLVCFALAVRLWVQRAIALHWLRWLESVLFGTVLALMGWEFASDLMIEGELHQPHATGHHALFHFASSWSLPFFALIVSYGALIPSSLRRCGVILAIMSLVPLAIGTIGGLAEGVFTVTYLQAFVLQMALWLAAGVAIALYGAHRLETLRLEVSETRKLGRYHLRHRIGVGGMGEVYLAEHELLRRPCAIKLIRPEKAGDPRLLELFEREVQAMATLTHPNVVQIYDYGRAEDGTFYYVMEYLPGLNLEKLVKRDGPLAPSRAVHLIRQVCMALKEAHASELVHRDLKPSNIAVLERKGGEEIAKLLDFGLVHVTGQLPGEVSPRTVAGSPAFMAPEQSTGSGEIDARSDIYSLGAVLYFVLTGRPPFIGCSLMETLRSHAEETPVAPSKLRSTVPADLDAVVLRCLKKTPTDRYANAIEMERALARCRCATSTLSATCTLDHPTCASESS